MSMQSSSRLAKGPWHLDLPDGFAHRPTYGPGASERDIAPATSPVQVTIPAEYRDASSAELMERICRARQRLGDSVVVLGHHYQRDEIIRFADFTGDSFKLAQRATTRPDADLIVFCGVYFMAETADVLSRTEQAVVLPNLAAGCSMADMAQTDDVLDCWEELTDLHGTGRDDRGRVPVIPVTYMNSTAALKAFCGRNGGIVCTSSNARSVLEWAFERGQRLLFFPDQHLGRNSGKARGVSLSAMPQWDPMQPLGGNDEETLVRSRIILWKGWCSVHTRFKVEQIDSARRAHPDVRVIVHPECPMEVVDAADANGSTEEIIAAVNAAPPGSTWGIGTEINLVTRLADAHPELTIFCLDPVVCPCSTMYRVHPAYLCWALENLESGKVVNRITVPEEVAISARVALRRMLEVPPR